MSTIRQEDYNKMFWKKLDIARRNRKISWGELARQMNMTRPRLLTARKNCRLFRVSRVFTLCDILDISMDELCDPDIEIKPNYERRTIYFRRPDDLTDEPKWRFED